MICQETGLDKSNSTNYVSGLDPPFSKVLYQGKGHRWALLGLKTVESKFQSFSNDMYVCIIVYSIFSPDPPPKQRRGGRAAEAREEIPILRCLQPQPVIFHFFIQVLFLFPVEEVFICRCFPAIARCMDRCSGKLIRSEECRCNHEVPL